MLTSLANMCTKFESYEIQKYVAVDFERTLDKQNDDMPVSLASDRSILSFCAMPVNLQYKENEQGS